MPQDVLGLGGDQLLGHLHVLAAELHGLAELPLELVRSVTTTTFVSARAGVARSLRTRKVMVRLLPEP
ncbi:hypothetical protein Mth01_41350 [Sphaerimonospora thailandensis]|uniref:Uncharacterized protein n=1 Tax=Sphaerimonospora thailandensis TaxID=795644 RepID=A0A8J3W0R0_9ACTN|nr:hypothetical protein Mth01_41350 [Sphaerimonospora thailandensis]